jgi:hypothetical protein
LKKRCPDGFNRAIRRAKKTIFSTALIGVVISNQIAAGISNFSFTENLPVSLDHIEIALSECRRTKAPAAHSFDLRRLIGVQLGAVIAEATALGFDVRSRYGVNYYAAKRVDRGKRVRHSPARIPRSNAHVNAAPSLNPRTR